MSDQTTLGTVRVELLARVAGGEPVPVSWVNVPLIAGPGWINVDQAAVRDAFDVVGESVRAIFADPPTANPAEPDAEAPPGD